MSRKHTALQRKIVRLAADWRDPHDQDTWATRDIVQNIEVAEDGEVGRGGDTLGKPQGRI